MEQINQRVEEYIASSQEEEVLERDRRAAETPEEYIPIEPEYIPTRTSQIQTPRGVSEPKRDPSVDMVGEVTAIEKKSEKKRSLL